MYTHFMHDTCVCLNSWFYRFGRRDPLLLLQDVKHGGPAAEVAPQLATAGAHGRPVGSQ